MNQNSFQMKGWAITVLSALLAIFAASTSKSGAENVNFLFVAIAPTIIFWFLDSYYLQQERKFRGLYNDVANITKESQKFIIKEFEMPLNRYKGCKYNFFNVLWSKTEWPLYFTIILGLSIAVVILR